MTAYYLRSTDGSDADGGTTWALARATMGSAAGLLSIAGDSLYISDNHAETLSLDTTYTFSAGTLAAPNLIVCVDDAGDPSPPTALAATAAITGGAGHDIVMVGQVYVQGVVFTVGGGASNTVAIRLANGDDDRQVYENCDFVITATGASSLIQIGGTSTGSVVHECTWINCDVKFGATTQGIYIPKGTLRWCGGSILAGGSTPATLFETLGWSSRPGEAYVDGVNFENAGATMDLLDSAAASGHVSRAMFRNCKLPSAWSGTLFSTSPPTGGIRGEMHNCETADGTIYRTWIEDRFGSIRDDTATYKNSGGADNGVALSHKYTSSADASEQHPLVGPEMFAFNTTTGSAITVSVDTLWDSATDLQDDEIWLEVQYYGTSGILIGSFTSDRRTNILTTPADQTNSAATWTESLTNDNEQVLSVSITPQEEGFLIGNVCLGRPSTTVYVDPTLQVA